MRIGFLIAGVLLAASCASRICAQSAPDEIDQLLALQREELDLGKYESVAVGLREMLDEESKISAAQSVTARRLLLEAEAARGAYSAADELDAGLAAAEGERAVAIARGRFALERGRLADAERLATAVLAVEPRDLEAAWIRVRVLFERGARIEARQVVKELIDGASATKDPDELLRRARLFEVVGDLEASARLCVQAEKLRREAKRPTADVLITLGDLYRRALSLDGGADGGSPRAFAAYRDALEQNSSLVAAKVGRAWMHLYVNDSIAAEREIEDALAVNANHPDALVVRAWIQLKDQRASDALATIDQVLAVNPSHKKARSMRASALYLLRRSDQYYAEVARVLILDPSYGEVYWTIGDALSNVYRFEEAIPFHEQAIKLDPELPLAPVSLGRDLCFCGREAEGKEALLASRTTHPFPHPWRNNMLLVLDRLATEFVRSTSNNFEILVHIDENPVLGPRLEAALESDLVKLEKKYGFDVDRSVLVEMFPSMSDFSVRSVGFTGVGAVGVCFGHFVTLVSPRSEARWTFVWRRTALHELTHVITLGRSKKRVPRWLTEGLSVYEERCANPQWNRDQIAELNDVIANQDLLRLRTFNAAFRGPRIGFGYYQGGLFCEFVDRTYGFDKLLAMLDAYAEDLETPAVVERVFGKTAEQLDTEFEQWIRGTILSKIRLQPNFGIEMRRKLRERVKQEPDNTDAIADLAFAYWQTGKAVDADIQLDKLRKLAPEHPAMLRLLGFRAIEKGKNEQAQQYLEKVKELGALEYRSAMALARIYSVSNREADAKAMLEEAMTYFSEDPGSDGALAALLQLAEKDEQIADEEVRWFDAIANLVESAVEPRIKLAERELSAGDAQTALTRLLEAENIDPFLRKVHRMKGQALRALSQPSEAIESLRVALLVDPTLEPSYSPPASPEEREQRGASERREQADILAEIAEIEFEVGDPTAARVTLSRAKELDPDSERIESLSRRLPQ